jgi:GNAT superfamily N-acetyltransferase
MKTPRMPGFPLLLRHPRPGDLGWVVHRHGAIYAREYGWGDSFEALVAEIVAAYLRKHDPSRERGWIAEKDREIVGFVFLIKESATVARLRLFLVEPSARGLGIGSRLVGACVRFARKAGYRKIVLSTVSLLSAARHIYQKAGFRLVKTRPEKAFGRGLTEEIWELSIRRRRT